MTWPNGQVWSAIKMILNCYDRLNKVSSIMKTEHDNIVIDCIDAVYDENETKFPYQIEPDVVYEEN